MRFVGFGGGEGVQDGCEGRIEVFVFRVDVTEKWKFKKNILCWVGECLSWGGGGGQGGCERRVEVFVIFKKKFGG